MVVSRIVKARIKGDSAAARWVDEHCKCGCRLRTDLKIVWCSGVSCNYYRPFSSPVKRIGKITLNKR